MVWMHVYAGERTRTLQWGDYQKSRGSPDQILGVLNWGQVPYLGRGRCEWLNLGIWLVPTTIFGSWPVCVVIFGDLSGGNYHIWVMTGVRDYIWGSEWWQLPYLGRGRGAWLYLGIWVVPSTIFGSWPVCVTTFGDLSGAKYHVWVVAGPHDVFLVFCPVS